MTGDKTRKVIDKVPLSNNRVHFRISYEQKVKHQLLFRE